MQLQQEKQIAKSDLLRKCGLLAHTSPAFLKNCWIKKLFSCLRLVIETPYSWKTNCVWFGRIASLSAFVLFTGVCVVRIAYEFFLDCSLQEFFMFLEWRTAVAFLFLDSYYCLLSTLCRGQLSPAPLAELSQLDRFCLRLVSCNQTSFLQ